MGTLLRLLRRGAVLVLGLVCLVGLASAATFPLSSGWCFPFPLSQQSNKKRKNMSPDCSHMCPASVLDALRCDLSKLDTETQPPPAQKRSAVKPRSALSYPQSDQKARLVSEDPVVFIYDNFLTGAECDHLVKLANVSLAPAEVSGDKGGEVSKARTNRVRWIDHETDEITDSISRRLSMLVGIPITYAEAFQVINYQTGELYQYHYDSYDHGTVRGEFNMQRGGQRLVTVLGYLNDVEAGGATSFWHLNLEVKPLKGRILIFHNCIEGTNLKHTKTLHQGNPPLKGIKWAFNLWFHEYPYQD